VLGSNDTPAANCHWAAPTVAITMEHSPNDMSQRLFFAEQNPLSPRDIVRFCQEQVAAARLLLPLKTATEQRKQNKGITSYGYR
jgi:hypothetical protein